MADFTPPSDEIPGASPTKPTKGFDKEGRIKPDKDSFRSYMKETPEPKKPATTAPIEAGQKATQRPPPTLDSLVNQVNTTQSSMNTLQDQLNQVNNLQSQLKKPQKTFKTSQQRLVKKKLTEARTALKGANQKTGGKEIAPSKQQPGASALEQFIGYVSNGQDQLNETKQQLAKMEANKDQQIDPSKMLLVQVKLAQAQQAIEYSSVIVSKVIEDLKQIIQIQI